MKEIVELLLDKGETISMMESCTGGMFANSITNIQDASKVFKFGAVTYSNEYKIKMGISKDVIDTYSVYSAEVAKEMAKKISEFSNSDYGVGITGKLNKIDVFNDLGNNNEVFISVYENKINKYHSIVVLVDKNSRVENKEIVINKTVDLLLSILKNK